MQHYYDTSKARLVAIRPDGTQMGWEPSIMEAAVFHMFGYSIDVYMWNGQHYYKRHTIKPTDLFTVG